MPGNIFKLSLMVAACLAGAPAALAQEDLPLPDGKDWTHEHSGISVPFTLAGLDRTGATAFSADSLNTGLSFNRGSEYLSVYVYRNTSGGVPVWFEQARYGILRREVYANPDIVGTTYSVALPGRTEATGLQAVYAAPESSQFTSTGLALFSLGGWYVKVRATSSKHDVAGLEAWIKQAIGELELPEALSAGPKVQAVEDCRAPLEFGKESKDAPQDGAANLLSGVLGMVVAEKRSGAKAEAAAEPEGADLKETRKAVQWCRDSTLGDNNTVYRADESLNRYLIAVGDSGIGVTVGPDEAAALLAKTGADKAERFRVTMHYDARDVNYVPQDRLPSPGRVADLINNGRSTMEVSTWDGKQITISASALD